MPTTTTVDVETTVVSTETTQTTFGKQLNAPVISCWITLRNNIRSTIHWFSLIKFVPAAKLWDYGGVYFNGEGTRDVHL